MLWTRQSDMPDSPPESSGWATFIGIVICLCGNVIISFALNIQRLAHERIQRKLLHNPSDHRDAHPPKPAAAGEHALDEDGTYYLKSKLWWTGLVLMAIGETGNFVACTFPHPCQRVTGRWICACID